MTATAQAAPAPQETAVQSANIYQLTSEQLHFQSQIKMAADWLASDDPDERQAAVETLEELLQAEEGNREARKKKCDSYCWVISELRAKAAFNREQADRLESLAALRDRQAEQMMDRLLKVLLKADPLATKFDFNEHRLTSRRSTSLSPLRIEAADLPEEFQRTKTTTTVEPDKTAIREFLNRGGELEWAELVERRSWFIK